MAGLNFQTQTIINSKFDLETGKPLFTAESGRFSVKRHFDFYKKEDKNKDKCQVVAIKKCSAHEPTMCKATVNMTVLQPKLMLGEKKAEIGRLEVYLGVEGAEPFIYSTPWVQKGIPFWVDFAVGEDAQTTAYNIVNAINKSHVFQRGNDLVKIVDFLKGNSVIVLQGTDEYQRFKNIKVSVFDPYSDDSKLVAKLGEDGIKSDLRGSNGFGTYSQIVKDLRLPTAANWQPYHLRLAETPEVGALYTQYILEVEGPAVNDGMQAVGERMTSHTTHVFWVKEGDVLTSFAQALETTASLGINVEDNTSKPALETAPKAAAASVTDPEVKA